MHSSAGRLAGGMRDAEHLVEALAVAPDAVDVERAPDLPAVPTNPYDAPKPQHSHVPRDPRLAHVQVLGKLRDVDLAHLAKALQDAQPGGVGKAQEVVRNLFSLIAEKHKAGFIQHNA